MKHIVLRLLVASLVLAATLPGAFWTASVGAQDGEPIATIENAATDEPQPEATEPPPPDPPTVPPPATEPPTQIPTLPPPPTPEPTQPPAPTATLAPPTATEVIPTETPAPTATATPSPTATATATSPPRFTIQAESVTLTLTPSDSVAVGSSVTAQAGNILLSLLGTLKYDWYTNNTCTGTPAGTNSKTILLSGAPASDPFTMTTLGTNSFKATHSYLLGLSLVSDTSGCTTIVVNKATPAVTLTVPTGTFTAGGAISLTSTVSGGYQRTGTVTYAIYPTSDCTATPTATVTTPTFTAAQQPAGSGAMTLIRDTTTGTSLSFRATYNGDSNNTTSMSDCVTRTVNKATPTLTMLVSNTAPTTRTAITADAGMTDWVLNAGGTVAYDTIDSANCDTGTTLNPPGTITKTVTGGEPAASESFTIPTSTAVRVRAIYSGDANNNAARVCVTITVSRVTPTLTVAMSPNPVHVGATAVARATLTNAAGTPSGTATYAVFSDATCLTSVTSTINGAQTLSGGAIPESSGGTFATAGTYYVRVTYSGDTGNNTVTSGCTQFRVSTPSTITLGVSPNPVEAGNTISTTSTLGGGATADAGGTVTYRMFSDATCATPLVPDVSTTVTVTNRTVPGGTLTTPLVPGTRYVSAIYTGDATNSGATSACVAVAITPRASTITVASSPPIVAIGASMQVGATLGNVTANASGTVTYRRASDAACTTLIGTDNVVTVVNGAVPLSSSLAITSATLYIRATYSGDSLNASTSTTCSAVPVSLRATTTSAIQTPPTVSIGSTFTLTGTVNNAFGVPTGTMTIQLYSASGCTTAIAGQTYALPLSGTSATTPSIAYTFGGGAWYTATYAGDTNNLGSAAACQKVSIPAGSLTASISDASLPPVGFSTESQQTTGTMVVTVSDLRGTGAGWSVTIQSGAFTYTGSAVGGGTLPANNLVLTGTGSPTVVSGQPIGAGGPTATNVAGSMVTARTVLIAGSGFGAGSYTQVIFIQLTIPGGTPSGEYSTDVTVTTSAAP